MEEALATSELMSGQKTAELVHSIFLYSLNSISHLDKKAGFLK